MKEGSLLRGALALRELQSPSLQGFLRANPKPSPLPHPSKGSDQWAVSGVSRYPLWFFQEPKFPALGRELEWQGKLRPESPGVPPPHLTVG